MNTGITIARNSTGERTVTVPAGYSFFIVKKKKQCKNVLALKACQPFSGATSVTAIESNRKIHPFIVVYDANPGAPEAAAGRCTRSTR